MQAAAKSKYTPEEKEQLLANLDLEVEQRTRQLEEWLADALTTFRLRHESLIAVVPPVVRTLTMGEFADKYDGDVHAAVRGIQMERRGVNAAPVDRTAMKRKWAQDQDGEGEVRGEGLGRGVIGSPTKANKHPRIAPPSPQKKSTLSAMTGSSRRPTTSQSKPSRTAPSPSPHKLNRHASSSFRPPASPSKMPPPARSRVPSASTFNPVIPKTPAYPPRWPHKHENMLSMNGSPLANPYELGLDWLASTDSPDAPARVRPDGDKGDRSSRSMSIVVRPESTHSRSNSQVSGGGGGGTVIAQSSFSARVAVPTKDGHMLEFDPLLTSPMALDRLEGITDSAKKQAKEDMARLLQQAVLKWNIDEK